MSDDDGFRTDVSDALRRLGMPNVRYPGGNFVSNYDWRDGVGPREERPARPDYAWRSIEPNTFGVDEFMSWCRSLDTEPYMAVNLGTLGPRDAADLVEYCNLDGAPSGQMPGDGTATRNPHDVRLWCLGKRDGRVLAGGTLSGFRIRDEGTADCPGSCGRSTPR